MSRDYYDIGGISVYDFIKAKELGFEEANIIKYVCRYKMKDGLADLEKAKWYLEKLIQKENKHPKIECPECGEDMSKPHYCIPEIKESYPNGYR